MNAAEEIGDHLWYLAIGANELNIPLAVIFDQNIDKLTSKKDGRFRSGSFDVDSAINRDLDAERANLENSLVVPAKSDERALIGTSSPHIFYSRDSEQFVLFDEAALEHSRHDSFDQAAGAQSRYAAQLDQPAAPTSWPTAATPSVTVPPLERFGAAAKSVANSGLEAMGCGIDKAKTYLNH